MIGAMHLADNARKGVSMRHFVRLFVLVCLLGIAACTTNPESQQPLPTLFPTATEAAPPTSTPVPRASATPMPAVPRTIADTPSDQVYLRMVHAAPGVENINFEIERLTLAANLGFGVTTAPTGLVAGDYRLQIRASGASADVPPILEQSLQVRGGQTLILLFTGTPETPALITIPEINEPLNRGETRVTVIHAIPRGPDVALRQGGANLTPVFSFGQASLPVVIASGPSTLSMQSGEQSVFDYPATLQERTNYTLILTGRADDLSTASVITITNRAPGRGSVRVINAGRLTIPVDVYLDDFLIAGALESSRAGVRQPIIAAIYRATVYPAGSDPATTAPLTSSQINVNPDETLSLIIAGDESGLQIARVAEDVSLVRPGQARITFLNALPGTPTASVTINGEPIPALSSLGYLQLSRPEQLVSQAYNFYWDRILSREANDTERLETADNIQLEAGFSYLYVLTGREIGQPPLIFSENVGVDEALADLLADVQPSPTPRVPTRLRFVNAIDSAPLIDFLLGEVVIATGIAYRQSTDFLIGPSGFQQISIRYAGTDTLIAGIDFDFQVGVNYTIFAYGYENNQINLLPAPEGDLPTITSDSARVRLVNLTQNRDLPFGLGYINAVEGSSLPPVLPTDSGTGLVNRPSIFLNTNRLINSVDGNDTSRFSLLSPGIYDFLIIVPEENTLAASFNGVAIAPSTLYEVVIYQDSFSSVVRGFIIEYPRP